MPPFIFESAFSIRMTLVSAFALEVTQQIHSLRASGVMSSQSAKTFGAEIIALRKSGGIVCTTPFPVESALVVIQIFYNFSHIFKTMPAIRLFTTKSTSISISSQERSTHWVIFQKLSMCPAICVPSQTSPYGRRN